MLLPVWAGRVVGAGEAGLATAKSAANTVVSSAPTTRGLHFIVWGVRPSVRRGVALRLRT